MARLGRGQTSIELIVLLSFMFVVLISFFFVIETKVRQEQERKQQDLSVQLADLLEREITLAAQVQPGYMREFALPPTLNNQNYTVTIEDPNTLVLNSSGHEYLRFLSVDINLTRLPSDSSAELLPPGKYTVILEKTDKYVRLRKDCVAQSYPTGMGYQQLCNTTYTD
jgi:hypothetical protein